MREMVDCINTGRQCEAGSSNCEDPENSPSPTADPPSEETDEPGPAPTDTPSENETPEPSPSPSMSDRTPDPASAPPAKKPAEAGPRACTSPLATQRAESAVSPTDDGDGGIGSAATADEGNGDDSAARPAPQAVTGDLAGTGTRLRPAALGALLLIVGFLLLRRVRQESR